MNFEIEQSIRELFQKSVDSDYSNAILDMEYKGKKIIERMVDDIMETSDYANNGFWSNGDVKLAIGRVLMDIFMSK